MTAGSATREALRRLDPRETVVSTLPPPSAAQRAVDTVTGWVQRRTSRRGLLVRAGLVGSALAVDPMGYVLKPGTAYAAVCGPGASCTSGWTVFCATINRGVNACPPGSIAAGWWKADGASLCGGKARYIIDCNATCSRCTRPGTRAGICDKGCWSCSCTCGPSSSCDRRKVCCNGFRYGQCNTQVRQVGGVHCRVVSCTPPWKFERCSTAPATDNRTRDHSSSQLPRAFTAITRRYMALGENGSVLRASVYGEVTLRNSSGTAIGRMQRYQRGRIYWSSSTGAREVYGAILRRYLQLGAERGLGFPISGEFAAGDGAGRVSRFQKGRISFHPQLGANWTRGSIRSAYEAAGAEVGPLGYPLDGEVLLAGAAYSRFQRGRITWRRGAGTTTLSGALAARYEALGAQDGVLGFPSTSGFGVAGGTAAVFQQGRISWREGSAEAFETRTQIAAHYVEREGGEAGRLGFPVAGETEAGGRRVSRFQNGTITYDATNGAVTTLDPA